MCDRRALRGAGSGTAIQTILENGIDGAIGTGIDLERPLAGSLQAAGPVRPGQPQNAKTRPEALFGMTAFPEDDFDQGFSIGSDPGGLPAHALWRPVGPEAVIGRHVICAGGMLIIARYPGMGGDPFAL